MPFLPEITPEVDDRNNIPDNIIAHRQKEYTKQSQY